MNHLARRLRATDYFTLGFGTMVGVGWLVVMDDWLGRGGPLGAILGFAVGGAALLPIGYVYGRLVEAIPDAASEIAYTGKQFGRPFSFATGWMMALAYLIVCPWEAVATGKIAAYIFPQLNVAPLYRVAGQTVYLPQLLIGLGLTVCITALNYRGIRLSATFQNATTFGLLTLFLIFSSLGLARGSPRNFAPLFAHGGFVSVLLVLQVVPYFMTGFESVPKCVEEARPEFRLRGFSLAIFLAIAVGVLFYTSVIAVVAYVAPWKSLANTPFAAAVAFGKALRNRGVVDLIFLAALLSLLKVFNGNFIAGSRLLFALGRRGLVDTRLGRVHPLNQTPAVAVVAAGILTALGTFLGQSILVPISEVGSMASAFGWAASCAAYLRMKPGRRDAFIALLGVLVGLALILMKVLPIVPGRFTANEFLALGFWVASGALLYKSGPAFTRGSQSL